VARFDRVIPPGGEGTITLAVETTDDQGNVGKAAVVTTNDPIHPQVAIQMSGNVWAPVFLAPMFAEVTGIRGQQIDSTVRLFAQKEVPLILDVASISVPDNVTVALNMLEKEKVYELHVISNIQSEGRFKGEVRLSTNYPEKPEITVPIVGYIKVPVEIRPKTLNFGRLSTSQLARMKTKGIAMQRPVIVKHNNGGNLKIIKVEPEKSLFRMLSSREMKPGRIIQLQIEAVMENLGKGKNADHLKIYTNQSDFEVIDVPVYLEVYDQ
jgi:hypothetical protein